MSAAKRTLQHYGIRNAVIALLPAFGDDLKSLSGGDDRHERDVWKICRKFRQIGRKSRAAYDDVDTGLARIPYYTLVVVRRAHYIHPQRRIATNFTGVLYDGKKRLFAIKILALIWSALERFFGKFKIFVVAGADRANDA